MLPESLTGDKDFCAFSERWGLRMDVAALALTLARAIAADPALRSVVDGGAISIISGFRTAEQQVALDNAGRPTAPVARSTHTSCPATGFDISIAPIMMGGGRTTQKAGAWRAIGRIAESIGLRWGGGSRVMSDGAPLDYNHFDAGPRR